MAPVLGPIDVPIVLGAFNQGMLRVAGRVADGIIGHGLFTDRWWDETIDPNLADGAAAAGRDPDDPASLGLGDHRGQRRRPRAAPSATHG